MTVAINAVGPWLLRPSQPFPPEVNKRVPVTYGKAKGWRRGVVVSGVGLINEVNRHRARLVLGWVTVCRRVNHLGM